jgi:hypothetical protein
MCICKVTEQHGDFFNAECDGPNGKKFYSIQANNAHDALVKARQMCIDDVSNIESNSINPKDNEEEKNS